jgi:hypothetical protein
MNARARLVRARVAAGLCIVCADPSKAYRCAGCQAYERELKAQSRAARMAAGLCVACRAPSENYRCEACQGRARARRRAVAALLACFLLLAACPKAEATPRSCRRMTCPAPSKPLFVHTYKARNLCVCAPPEEHDPCADGCWLYE